MMSYIKQKLSNANLKWLVGSILFLAITKAAASYYFGGAITFEPIAIFIILWSSYLIGIKAKNKQNKQS